MVSHYLLPHILQPTRVADHSATIIDNIFTNATEFTTVSGNILNKLADHFSQFLVIKKLPITHKNAACHQYDYSNFDKSKSLADFSKINWNDTQNIPDDVNEEFSIFLRKFLCVKNHVPLIKLRHKKISLRSKPWISVKIEQMMVKRDKYLRKFNGTKSLDMEYLYKKFRNKVVSEIRKNKNDYYSQYFTKHLTDIPRQREEYEVIYGTRRNAECHITSILRAGVEYLFYFMTNSRYIFYHKIKQSYPTQTQQDVV